MNLHSDALNGSKEVQTVQRTGTRVRGTCDERSLVISRHFDTAIYLRTEATLALVIEPTFSWKIFKNYCSIENRQKSEKNPGHQGKRMAREDFCKRYS